MANSRGLDGRAYLLFLLWRLKNSQAPG